MDFLGPEGTWYDHLRSLVLVDPLSSYLKRRKWEVEVVRDSFYVLGVYMYMYIVHVYRGCYERNTL